MSETGSSLIASIPLSSLLFLGATAEQSPLLAEMGNA